MNNASQIARLASGFFSSGQVLSLLHYIEFNTGMWFYNTAATLTDFLRPTHTGDRFTVVLMALFAVWLVGGLLLYADEFSTGTQAVDQPPLAILVSLEDLALEIDLAPLRKKAA